MNDPSNATTDVVLRLGLRSDRSSTLRLLVASMAADAGFDVDGIDDLRLAISEVFLVCLATAPEATMTATMRPGSRSLIVEMSIDGGSSEIEFDDLAQTILSSVVDEVAVDGPSVRLVKRAHSHDALD